jgi:cytoskeleton protein RodZ
MKKTGQLLKEARETKSVSLQEVSIHLKINTKTLKALELGDVTQLPAKTFLRGFVQSYAQYLKLDLNQIMEVFQEEMGTTHPSMITTQVAQPPINYNS